jgi:hypothetical protein
LSASSGLICSLTFSGDAAAMLRAAVHAQRGSRKDQARQQQKQAQQQHTGRSSCSHARTHEQLIESELKRIIVVDQLRMHACQTRAEAAVRSGCTAGIFKYERPPQALPTLCMEHVLSDWRQCVNVTCAIEPSDQNFSPPALT